jgi:hypothetical protein
MADFSADFRKTSQAFWPTTDPFDFTAVFAPFVAVTDHVPPTVTVVSPPIGSIGPYSTVVLRTSDNQQLVRVNLWVEYANGNTETIYGGGQFMRRFRRASAMTTLIANRQYEFTLRPLGGWPRGGMDFQIEAVDVGGNVSE